jgi:hypothetical protein
MLQAVAQIGNHAPLADFTLQAGQEFAPD